MGRFPPARTQDMSENNKRRYALISTSDWLGDPEHVPVTPSCSECGNQGCFTCIDWWTQQWCHVAQEAVNARSERDGALEREDEITEELQGKLDEALSTIASLEDQIRELEQELKDHRCECSDCG